MIIDCESCEKEDCGNCLKYISHWKKPDHIGFLLLLPFALLMLLNPWAIIPFVLCWICTLIYDVGEQK